MEWRELLPTYTESATPYFFGHPLRNISSILPASAYTYIGATLAYFLDIHLGGHVIFFAYPIDKGSISWEFTLGNETI